MRCGACGYSLDGLSLRSRCPECGSHEREDIDRAEIERLLASKLRQSLWVPLVIACTTVLLGMMHALLIPVIGIFMLILVGVLAEDVTRLRGFLHPEWTPTRWLTTLAMLLVIYGAYFVVVCVVFWRIAHSPLVRSFF